MLGIDFVEVNNMMTSEGEQKISLAIDGGHNIRGETYDLLKGAGFRFTVWENGKLHAVVEDDPILGSITICRGEDISFRLVEGVHKFAIYGRDRLRDAQLGGMEITEIAALGISICQVALEVPVDSWYQKPEDLEGARIAASLRNLARDYFERHHTNVRFVQYTGKEEGAPGSGAADASVAIYETGGSMIENDLRRIDKPAILISEGVLAAPTKFLEEHGSELIVRQFIDRITQTVGRSVGVVDHSDGDLPISVPRTVQMRPAVPA